MLQSEEAKNITALNLLFIAEKIRLVGDNINEVSHETTCAVMKATINELKHLMQYAEKCTW